MALPLPLPDIEAEALGKGSAAEALAFVRSRLEGDGRTGAQKLLLKFQKRVEKDQKEAARLQTLLKYETEAFQRGHARVAGVDEAGRGPLAGPVVAAAVILSPDALPAGVNDSKKLTPEKREELFPLIQQKARAFGIGQASVAEIDTLNIYQAARLAMERAIEALDPAPDFLLTDAMPLPKFKAIPQKPLVHGDALSLSIAAASILAKVTRDRMMGQMQERYPQYGFENHKGYGTEEHLAALGSHGPCPEHRLSFGPVLESVASRFPGGPVGFWTKKLEEAVSLAELQQMGLQIKRLFQEQLTASQLEGLRTVFRRKKGQWADPSA